MTYRAAPSHLHRDRVPWTAHGSALSDFQTHQLYQPEAAEVAGDDVGFTVAGAVAGPRFCVGDRAAADGSPLRAEPFFQKHQLYLPEAMEITGDDVGFAVAGAIADDLPRRTEPLFQTHQPNLPEVVEVAGDDVDLAVAEAAADGSPLRAEPFFQTHQLYLPEAVEIAGDDVRLAVAEAVTGCAILRLGGSCGWFTASRRAIFPDTPAESARGRGNRRGRCPPRGSRDACRGRGRGR